MDFEAIWPRNKLNKLGMNRNILAVASKEQEGLTAILLERFDECESAL